MHILIHIYIHIYIYICAIFACMRFKTNIYIYILFSYTCIYLRKYEKQICICMCLCMCICICICICICTKQYVVHAYVYIHKDRLYNINTNSCIVEKYVYDIYIYICVYVRTPHKYNLPLPLHPFISSTFLTLIFVSVKFARSPCRRPAGSTWQWISAWEFPRFPRHGIHMELHISDLLLELLLCFECRPQVPHDAKCGCKWCMDKHTPCQL